MKLTTPAVLLFAALYLQPAKAQRDDPFKPTEALLAAATQFEHIETDCSAPAVASLIAACLAAAEKRVGIDLEQFYQAALKVLPADLQTSLRNAQRGWLQYQEQSCEIARRTMLPDGPGFAAQAKAACLLRSTLVRMEELRALSQPRR